MTHPMLYVVSSLIYLCCQLLPGESQTITVNPVGVWTEGESVTLACTISTYPGQMRWLLGSTDVASCNPDTCDPIRTGDGAYFFGFDTTNHIFLWTINPVKKSNHGAVFKCSDGTSTANFTATVTDKATTTTTTTTTTAEPSNSDLSIAALCLGIILPLCVLAAFIVYICCCTNGNNGNGNTDLEHLPWRNDLEKLIDKKIKTTLEKQELGKQPWKSELDKLIVNEIAKELKKLDIDKQPWKKELERLIKPLIEQELQKLEVGKQPWKQDFDKLIDDRIEHELKKQEVDKHSWKNDLEKLIGNMIEKEIKKQNRASQQVTVQSTDFTRVKSYENLQGLQIDVEVIKEHKDKIIIGQQLAKFVAETNPNDRDLKLEEITEQHPDPHNIKGKPNTANHGGEHRSGERGPVKGATSNKHFKM